MVYINEISGSITIPKHTQSSGTYTLILTSNMTNPVTLVEDGSNISTNPLYYKFALDSLNNLNVGEYTYTLCDNSNSVLETGLLTYGDFNREVIVNNTTVKEKIQYNPYNIEPADSIKSNTYYYGFGIDINDMLKSKNTKAASNTNQFSFVDTSMKEDSRFYVIYDADMIYNKPIEFTCGGAPMVMEKTRMIVNNKMCDVWTSGEIYPANVTLTVISINN